MRLLSIGPVIAPPYHIATLIPFRDISEEVATHCYAVGYDLTQWASSALFQAETVQKSNSGVGLEQDLRSPV